MRLFPSWLKTGIGRAVHVLPFVQSFLKKGLTVFVFHEVTDEPSPFQHEYGLAVSNETFDRQVSWILENFQVVHPRALVEPVALPPNSALITFDDGFVGAFENGLRRLIARKVPSLAFLNMGPIMEQTPMLSAKAIYLVRQVPAFREFLRRAGLGAPIQLTLTPAALRMFEQEHGPVDHRAVLAYQGRFADSAMVTAWARNEHVVYGNHLYDHWNATALRREEFVAQFHKNEEALSGLPNYGGFFAFPNGQPGTSFAPEHVALLRTLGALRVFAAAGGANRDPASFMLGRIALGPRDDTSGRLWGCVFKGVVKRTVA